MYPWHATMYKGTVGTPKISTIWFFVATEKVDLGLIYARIVLDVSTCCYVHCQSLVSVYYLWSTNVLCYKYYHSLLELLTVGVYTIYRMGSYFRGVLIFVDSVGTS